MTAEKLIKKALSRGARHVRLLSLMEGALLLVVWGGGTLFAAILLDHLFSLSKPPRMALLVALASVCLYVFFGNLFLPAVRSISRLYVARRVEKAFPHFKDSLTTFVQMGRARRRSGVGPLVAHRAAGCFQGVDIDAGLDAGRFVRLGYAFVILMFALFGYSLFSAKSMWTSFVRIVDPWTSLAAPTRTHIGEVTPGNARVLQGTDLAVRVEISGVVPGQVLVHWSRDSELWQSVPTRPTRDHWAGAIEHVETDLVYLVTAGDATSARYFVTVQVPPVVESVAAILYYPQYMRRPARKISQGNIEAPIGTTVSMHITSNKILKSASLRMGPDRKVPLALAGAEARGDFTVARSGPYWVELTDAEGLASQAPPVKYDIVALPDGAPRVLLEGPEDGTAAALDEPVDFVFAAADDYGVSRLVFHYQTVEGNPYVKEYALPGDRKKVVRRSQLVPELLGARRGDTISYYLQAFDNCSGRPNSSRTPTRTLRISPVAQEVLTGEQPIFRAEDPSEGADYAGSRQGARGTAEKTERAGGGPQQAYDGRETTTLAESRSRLLEMIENDREAWETISRHIDRADSPEEADVPPDARESPAPEADPASEATRPKQVPPAEWDPGRNKGHGGPAAASDSRSKRGPGGRPGQTPSRGDYGGAMDGESPPLAPEETAPAIARRAKPDGSQDARRAEGGTSPGRGEAPSKGAAAEQEPDREPEETPDEQEPARDPSESPPPEEVAPPGQEPAKEDAQESEDPPENKAEPVPASESEAASPGQAPAGEAAGAADQGAQASRGEGAGESAAPGSQGPAPSLSSGAATGEAPPGAAGGAAGTTAPPATSEDSASDTSATAADSGASTGQSGAEGGGGSGRRGPGPEFSRPGDLPDPEGFESPSEYETDRRIGRTRRLLSRLSRDLRERMMDEGMLKDLGWEPARLRTFVRDYEDVLGKVEPSILEEEILLESEFGSGQVTGGSRRAVSVGSADTAGAAGQEGRTGASRAFIREEVSPEYREIVEEYYRALPGTSQ